MSTDLGSLDDLPRATLGHGPTPLEAMPNLARRFDGLGLFVKRDDCTGLALGGNKVRQLEFYIGEAEARGADTILITGAVQSNFVRTFFLMVSFVPTYSGKMFGQKVAREYVLPVFVLGALYVAVLLTYPYITLTLGTLAYLAVIPFSFFSYRRRAAKAALSASAQNGSRKRKNKTALDEQRPSV